MEPIRLDEAQKRVGKGRALIAITKVRQNNELVRPLENGHLGHNGGKEERRKKQADAAGLDDEG